MTSFREAASDTHLSRIVRVLCDNSTVVVSGTKLADEIGVSRSEVWRLIEQLRTLGVQIVGHPAEGYRLESIPDLLLPDLLAPLVKGTIFSGHIHHYFRVNSTNVAGMQAAQAGEPEGTVLFAEEQTAGHGRGGHSWHSARSTGIYVSVVLRPKMSPVDVLSLSLLAGLATATAVEAVTGVRPDLRWPNDLMLPHPKHPLTMPDYPLNPEERAKRGGQRKFCGILTEIQAEATRVRHAVIGIGINVNQPSFPDDLQTLATSLRVETGREWSRVNLAAALLQSVDREYRLIQQAGTPDDLFRRFEEASSYARGLRVHVDEDGGYTGITDGLDRRGFLLVRADSGPLKTVLSGGVRRISDL